jgi:hypothetical protein
MWLLAFKLIVTPLLVGLATLAGRRWGHGISGWLAAFPLVSAPISIIFVIQYGPEFAARAAIGTIGGVTSDSVYCVLFCLLARRFGWQICIGAAIIGFLATTALMNYLSLPLAGTIVISAVSLALAIWITRIPPVRLPRVAAPSWDLPARMITTGLFVLALSQAAEGLGPQLSGLLSPFPIVATTLSVFNFIHYGPEASVTTQRGVIKGLYSFGTFFTIVTLLVTVLPPPFVYLLAGGAALALNTFLLRFVREKQPAAVMAVEESAEAI